MKKAFKVLTMVCLVATMALMSSCAKDKEDLIVGSWKLTNVESTPANPFAQILVNNMSFTFNADKTGTVAVTVFGENDESACTWSIDNDKLTIKYVDEEDDEPIVADILSLDKKELKIQSVEEEEGVRVTMDMTFTRQ